MGTRGAKIVSENENAKDYVFHSFDGSKTFDGNIKNVELKSLESAHKIMSPEHQKVIKVERQLSEEIKFNISPIVKQYRGINEQEKAEKDQFIEEQVERRLGRLKEEAYKAGYEEGMQRGHHDIIEQTKEEAISRLVALETMIQSALQTEGEILKNQKDELYRLIKTLAKWIILRELKDDGEYVVRLLEKLITEIGTRDHLLIQVNKNDFEKMPEILAAVEGKIGKLTNIRFECDHEVHAHGIVVESLNSIIRGTIDEQFKNLDKLFEGVGVTK